MQYNILYCDGGLCRVGCNRVVCIARGLMGCRDYIAIQFAVLQEKAGKVGIVSQYTSVYCDCGAKARLYCITIQGPAKPRYGQEARRRRGAHAGAGA